MPTNVEKALQHLNKSTGESRQYDIRQEGDKFTLVMPGGGSYPAADGNKTVERLITLCNAAEGRAK